MSVGGPELSFACAVMAGFGHPWFVAGGWALDLALGKQTRPHHDADLTVFRTDLPSLLDYLSGWDAWVAKPGCGGLSKCEGVHDARPPRHELYFRRGDNQLEVLLTDGDLNEVKFRRDPTIVMPYSVFARRDQMGRPYVAPEWQLLYKAGRPRPQDESDFVTVAPLLGPRARSWLLEALRRHRPASPWVAALEQMDVLGR